MKKILATTILTLFTLPLLSWAEIKLSKPLNASIVSEKDSVTISWQNPSDSDFLKVVIFRSTIPIEEYFTFEAVRGLCEQVHEGSSGTFSDHGLAENLPYYYIIFSENQSGKHSGAIVLERKNQEKETKKSSNTEIISGNEEAINLSGATSQVVNKISYNEAGIVYNFNQESDVEISQESRRLALFIIVKSPHDLTDNDKNSISYFIHEGTPTTIVLGSGERAGVLNSYLSVFEKLPRSTLEWQDIIKIANGRWPDEKNLESEERAASTHFAAIYQRKPDMDNPNDNAAVTVIAYGLRPTNRSLESEKRAIQIYRAIFDKSPVEASDWDLVRAIAYSGAVR